MRAYEREVTSRTDVNDRVKSKGITTSLGDVAIILVIQSEEYVHEDFSIENMSCLCATGNKSSVPTEGRLQYIKFTRFLNTVHFDKIV